MSNNSSSSGGMSCSGFLIVGMFLIFLALKLTGYITWSWVWVTAPLWGGFALVAIIFVIAFLGIFILTVLDKVFDKI